MKKLDPDNLFVTQRTVYLPNYLRDLLDKGNRSAHARFIIGKFLDVIDKTSCRDHKGTKIMSINMSNKLIRQVYDRYLKDMQMNSFSEFVRLSLFWYFLQNNKIYRDNCSNCNKPLNAYGKQIEHINIDQDPPVKKFCSQECKKDWIIIREDK